MKVYKDLNIVMRAGRIRRGSLRRQNEAGGVVGFCISGAALLAALVAIIRMIEGRL